MAKRKKTWVERTNYSHLDDDCELPDYLVFAVYTACKRLGWDMGVTRQSETFRKIETWLPNKDYENSSDANVDVIIDTGTSDNLFKRYLVPVASTPSIQEKSEAESFMTALDFEVKHMLHEWEKKHPAKVENQKILTRLLQHINS